MTYQSIYNSKFIVYTYLYAHFLNCCSAIALQCQCHFAWLPIMGVVMIPGARPHTRVILSHCYTLITDHSTHMSSHQSAHPTLWWLSPHSPDTRVWFIVRLIHPFIARHDHLEVNKVRIYNPSPLLRENISHDHLSQPEVCQWFNIASVQSIWRNH